MDRPFISPWKRAKEEMENIKKSYTPLASILLITALSHPDLEKGIQRLPREVIDRIEARLDVIFRILEYQKNKFYRSKEYIESIRFEPSYDETFCDFKEVMKILGKSKGSVESLIDDKEINVIQRKRGCKRKFVREEIIKYSKGNSNI
jgi:hypothetical protein